ncbi:hypothetical protein [Agrobacterium tumefaciens]|uniref:hypothetical protein n=1 Tax=Agrobacterium tumefaciens TaxID=358 RepID=UPI0013010D5D
MLEMIGHRDLDQGDAALWKKRRDLGIAGVDIPLLEITNAFLLDALSVISGQTRT